MDLKRLLLWALAVLLGLMAFAGNIMSLIYPMWILTSLYRDPLRRLLDGLPLSVAFIGSGVVFGLFTEVLAIVNNLNIPPEKRVLLSPDPLHDVVYGLGYYTLLILSWYGLHRLYRYNQRDVFFLTGLLGIFTEQLGQVFIGIFTVPVMGALYALIIVMVYGIFPMLATKLTQHRLDALGTEAKRRRWPVAMLVLALQWCVYGLVVLPILKLIYP